MKGSNSMNNNTSTQQQPSSTMSSSTSFVIDNYFVDATLINEATLSVQIFNIITNKSFNATFDASFPSNKQLLLNEIQKQQISITVSTSPHCAHLALIGGLLVLSLPACEDNANNVHLLLALLQNKVKYLEQHLHQQQQQHAEKVEQLEQRLQQLQPQQQQQQPIVHLSTSGTISDATVLWNITKRIDKDSYTLSPCFKQITVHKEGYYRLVHTKYLTITN